VRQRCLIWLLRREITPVVTLEELQQGVARLPPDYRLELYRTCPLIHPPEKLLALETRLASGVLRYCPRCLVVCSSDGRALNPPGPRQERGEAMSDERPFYVPNEPPHPPRQPQPGELLFEFYEERDHRWRCELRAHPEPYGIEAQFFLNEELFIGRRFDRTMDPTRPPRELAIAWAQEWRKGIEEGEL
jgi:hypothetical protein